MADQGDQKRLPVTAARLLAERQEARRARPRARTELGEVEHDWRPLPVTHRRDWTDEERLLLDRLLDEVDASRSLMQAAHSALEDAELASSEAAARLDAELRALDERRGHPPRRPGLAYGFSYESTKETS